MDYDIKCANGVCKGKLKHSKFRSYEIPTERVCPKLAERIRKSPHGQYRGLGLYVEQRSIDDSARTVLFTASTGAPDRMGDVIEQDGWQLENYQANPIGLFAHDSTGLPIAKGLRTQIVGGKLIWLAQFATVEQNPFADQVFNLIAGGFLNAVSVGFIPLEFEYIENDSGFTTGLRFTKCELLEVSIVPIPANPEALVSGKGQEAELFKLSKLANVETSFEQWLGEIEEIQKRQPKKTFVDELIDACSRQTFR